MRSNDRSPRGARRAFPGAFRWAMLPLMLLSGGLAALDLVDFSKEEWFSRGPLEDISVKKSAQEFGESALVQTGMKSPWPSYYLVPENAWDLSGFGEISFPVKNLDREPMMLYCKVVSASATGARKSSTFITLVEGERQERIHIPLIPLQATGALKASDFFGMRGLPFFGADGLYPEKIEKIVLFVFKPSRVHRFAVGLLQASGEPALSRLPKDPFPFIDRFGQFRHKEWPGKIGASGEYAARRQLEDADLKSHPAPGDWDRFGGDGKGPRLAATGAFRVEKVGGKWLFVDPDGGAFFSHGLNCVGYQDPVGLAGRETWFQSLPPDSGATGVFYSDLPPWIAPANPFYGKTNRVFNFFQFNLSEKYGPRWEASFEETTRRRLPSWGLNTVGNWSLTALSRGATTPYTATTYSMGPAISARGLRFPDPFDPGFREKTIERIRGEVGPVADDPWCLGVFVDNERPWGDELGLALAVLASPPSQAAKIALRRKLMGRDAAIEGLNRRWGSAYPSWEAFLESTNAAPEAAKSDLTNFYRDLAEAYFSTIKAVLKEVAPKRLYLGCRFSTSNPLVAAAAGKSCDVVSFNIYSRSPTYMNRALAEVGDRPVIIGEFHFGALDRGLFHGGLVPVKDQAERAAAYELYVADCLRHPQIVGCHYFQYTDQPAVGRVHDGENYQIGFIDIADQPYPELVAASRKMGAALYRLPRQ